MQWHCAPLWLWIIWRGIWLMMIWVMYNINILYINNIIIHVPLIYESIAGARCDRVPRLEFQSLISFSVLFFLTPATCSHETELSCLSSAAPAAPEVGSSDSGTAILSWFLGYGLLCQVGVLTAAQISTLGSTFQVENSKTSWHYCDML